MAVWAIVPDNRLTDGRNFTQIISRLTNGASLHFRGFQFDKPEKFWEGEFARPPDQSWIVLLSSSGRWPSGTTSSGSRGGTNKLFTDVYNTDTGKKLLTIVGTYLNIDPRALNQALWVTERYFILPLGEQRERCLVCDFGRADRERGLRP